MFFADIHDSFGPPLGHTSRDKVVEVQGLDEGAVTERLASAMT